MCLRNATGSCDNIKITCSGDLSVIPEPAATVSLFDILANALLAWTWADTRSRQYPQPDVSI
jgi:hypothetical protein